MFSMTPRSLRFFAITLFMALLALTGCQTAPQKGLTPAQITVLKQQGFELTDEGWAFGLSGKVLFGSDDDSLNPASTEIVERIGQSLLGVGIELDGQQRQWHLAGASEWYEGRPSLLPPMANKK